MSLPVLKSLLRVKISEHIGYKLLPFSHNHLPVFIDLSSATFDVSTSKI